MWTRKDWRAFYQAAKGRSGLSLPPRPLLRADRNRLVPAEGFSLDELLAAGVSLATASISPSASAGIGRGPGAR